MNNKPIGILDSGVGGLSVYKEIVQTLPHESTVYIGDNAFAPYGVLPGETIYERAVALISFLLEKDAKLIVIACNTITVTCIDKLRETFPYVPIVGTVPVVKTAAEVTENNTIGILSTTSTAESSYQKDLINRFAGDKSVINIGTDQLVPFIEQGITQGKALEVILQEVLLPVQEHSIDTLALGCTHYPFITEAIRDILGPDVKILDSGEAIARQVKRLLEDGNMHAVVPTAAVHAFYTTGEASHIDNIAKKLLGGTITSTTVSI